MAEERKSDAEREANNLESRIVRQAAWETDPADPDPLIPDAVPPALADEPPTDAEALADAVAPIDPADQASDATEGASQPSPTAPTEEDKTGDATVTGEASERAADSATATASRDADPAWQDFDLFVEQLAKRQPTIGVIGTINVGKSFLITQATHRGIDEGGDSTKKELDSSLLTTETVGGEASVAVDPNIGERLDLTKRVAIHNIQHRTHPFRLIDFPGEFFAAAEQGGFSETKNDRIAKMYAALMAADALLFLIPAHEVFGEPGKMSETGKAKRSVAMLSRIRNVSLMLDNELGEERKRRNLAPNAPDPSDLKGAVVRSIVNWSPEQLAEQLERQESSRCSKSVLVLFSQADRCFGIGAERNANGYNGRLPEHDPMLCAARHLPGLVNQLFHNFDDFKIDFVTAAEGQPHNESTLLFSRPRIGLGNQILWLLNRIAAREEKPPPGRIDRWLRPVARGLLLLGKLEEQERKAGWVVALRAKAEPEFKRAIEIE